ncbi:MAG: prolipoprotein diacylglyceryl transferase [Proteobacteria bacterium]|nr:prolipoprotein diacylglyceryl transferase [Pseudomonadota bacterium]MDA1058716.1 prolipoprotein diacylglyceryl transferase [Pseudomonadota bacterium]
MILSALPFPTIDPVLIAIGPFAIRWYAIAYIAGIVLAWRLVLQLIQHGNTALSRKDADDFVVWATVGIILGGRLGYVLFYRPEFYLSHPVEILFIWQGGMSFHGGLLGVTGAIILFCRKRGLRLFAVADLIAVAGPVGLFFGRIANFINAELFGRATDLPWGVVFPTGGPLPRHPSQLYEAGLEGIVLFGILIALYFATTIRHRPGLMTGVFVAGYAAARLFVEMFREPDAHLGFLAGGITMGQVLSVPLLLFGIFMIGLAMRRAPTVPGLR